MVKEVFLTGATGTMGSFGLKELLKYVDKYHVTVLARPSRKNKKLLASYKDKISIVWGELTCYEDVARGVVSADYVLHVGGMVSPKADYFPEKTMQVNITAAENIVRAVLKRPDADKVKVVYIGSVAETSDRNVPLHWGRIGDPVYASEYDYYSLSKIAAERIFVDSGLKHWVSLRQSGILYPGILRNFDPIMFHVPVSGVLEWATVEDSGRLLERVCRDSVPEEFWNRFYNISSGPQYRMTNYEFERRVLKAVNCPPPEKVFESNWFVLKNFHGQYYLDADILDNYLHFRENVPVDDYFENMSSHLPKVFKLASIVPSAVFKFVLGGLAHKKKYGTQYWIEHNDERKIKAYYGSRNHWEQIPDWENMDLSEPVGAEKAVYINHGYDENKKLEELTLEEIQRAAQFRGGRVLAESYAGDGAEKLLWECHCGHRFMASPKLILEGGHWCPECLSSDWQYDALAEHSAFFAQVYNGGKNNCVSD